MPGNLSGAEPPAEPSAASRRRTRSRSTLRSRKCSRISRRPQGRNRTIDIEHLGGELYLLLSHHSRRKENFMNANYYKSNIGRRGKLGVIITLVLFSALVVPAQEPAPLKEMIARAQQQNAQALEQYTWKSRNEVKKNGESKTTQLFLMRYDTDGNLQKSLIGGSKPPAMPKGPILAHIAQKKKEEFIELINDLKTQVEAYSHLNPAKMQAFLARATITPKLEQGLIQVQGASILQLQDSMTIWLDAKTRKQRRVEINTFLEKNLVKAVIEFNDLPAGPTHMSRTVVDYPKHALQLITENFDYQRESK